MQPDGLGFRTYREDLDPCTGRRERDWEGDTGTGEQPHRENRTPPRPPPTSGPARGTPLAGQAQPFQPIPDDGAGAARAAARAGLMDADGS